MHYDTFYNIENIRNLYTQLLEYKSVGEHVDSQVETSSRILSYSRVENMTSLVRKPAPKWKATAVVQGRIIETNSEVYEGQRIYIKRATTNQISRPFPPANFSSFISLQANTTC